ncbi:MAG TPA: RNA-processing protein [Candidatus Aenigmarchaeota archaeon]|nr:RNA-processing protein [Candidatus Aenigmarchaeota archaeon]
MFEMYADFLRIPKQRVGLVREEKERLERELGVKIEVNPEGEITLEGEGINLWNARNVIKAIGRGFDVETALLLKEEGYNLEVVDIEDYGKSKNALKRLRGRVIGRNGKAKEKIEELTDTNICVSGKTVSIIGRYDDAMIAREAVERLLGGAMHATVFRFLEKKRREKKIKGGTYW